MSTCNTTLIRSFHQLWTADITSFCRLMSAWYPIRTSTAPTWPYSEARCSAVLPYCTEVNKMISPTKVHKWTYMNVPQSSNWCKTQSVVVIQEHHLTWQLHAVGGSVHPARQAQWSIVLVLLYNCFHTYFKSPVIDGEVIYFHYNDAASSRHHLRTNMPLEVQCRSSMYTKTWVWWSGRP